MSHINNLFYGFGSFQLDLNKRVLTCSGQTISLAPKAKEILIRLVANAGQLVEKDELLREIWPDTFVEEANLTQNIFTLRRALGDDRIDPRYIETVTRRAYCSRPHYKYGQKVFRRNYHYESQKQGKIEIESVSKSS